MKWINLERGVVRRLIILGVGNVEGMWITWLFCTRFMWKKRRSIHIVLISSYRFFSTNNFVFPWRNRDTPNIRQLILIFFPNFYLFLLPRKIQFQIQTYLRNILQSFPLPDTVILNFFGFWPWVIEWFFFLLFDLRSRHFLDFIFVYKCVQYIPNMKFLLDGFGASSSQFADITET